MDHLLAVLQAAASQDKYAVKQAGAQLQAWEITPGFYESLQHIYINEGCEDGIRLIAAIYFKNGIDKYWRRSAENGITADEKDRIRGRLLDGSVSIQNPQIVAQNSLAISRVARSDFPAEWPNLFTEVIAMIASNVQNPIMLFRHMRTLLELVKMLCSQRLSRSRANFQNITPDVFQVVASIYMDYSSRWTTSYNAATSLDIIKVSDVALKVARRLVCHGYEYSYREPVPRSFFTLVTQNLESIWALAGLLQWGSNGEKHELLFKHIFHIGKFYRELATNRMASYATNYSLILMPNSMSLVRTYWNLLTSIHEIAFQDDSVKKIALQSLLLLRECIKLLSIPKNHLSLMQESERMEIEESIRLLHSDIFSPSSIAEIIENLITKFFVLRPGDAEDWNEDPESWILAQDVTQFEYELRPCAELVFVDLFGQFQESLMPLLLSALSTINSADRGLLEKEAMYNAIGLAFQHNSGQSKFANYFDGFRTEASRPNTDPILKRRITLLISRSTADLGKLALRSAVFELIGTLMSDAHFGVSLSAAFAVDRLIDTWEFDTELFKPYFKFYVESLVRILRGCKAEDSRTIIMGVIGQMFERMQDHLTDEHVAVLQMVPSIWQKAAEQAFARGAIMVLLGRIAASLRSRSIDCHTIAASLIQRLLDPEAPTYFMEDDALELWRVLLHHAPSPSESLIQLYPSILPHYRIDGDGPIREVLRIIESNMLLMSDEVLGRGWQEKTIVSLFDIKQMPIGVMIHVYRVIEIVTRVWTPSMMDQKIIWYLTERLLGESDDAKIDVCILSILSRLALADPHFVVKAWTTTPRGDCSQQVIAKYTERFDNIGHPKYRKLNAMGLASIVGTRHASFTADNSKSLIPALYEIFIDVCTEAMEAGNDLLYWEEDSLLDEDAAAEGTAELGRARQFSKTDPIMNVSLQTFVKDRIEWLFPGYLDRTRRDVLGVP